MVAERENSSSTTSGGLERISAALFQQQVEQLDALTRERGGSSRSAIIREALDKFFKNREAMPAK